MFYDIKWLLLSSTEKADLSGTNMYGKCVNTTLSVSWMGCHSVCGVLVLCTVNQLRVPLCLCGRSNDTSMLM